jgi:hypothetical protein
MFSFSLQYSTTVICFGSVMCEASFQKINHLDIIVWKAVTDENRAVGLP